MSNDIEHALHPPRFTSKGSKSIRLSPLRRDPTSPFEWPLRAFNNSEPRVLAVHDGDSLGVDLGYRLAVSDHEIPVFAVNDGEVACAIEDRNGCAISLDHGGTWSTHYTGLSKLSVIRCLPRLRRREYVRVGQVIGYANKPRIGFELWKWTNDRGFVAVAPRAHLAEWARVQAELAEAA